MASRYNDTRMEGFLRAHLRAEVCAAPLADIDEHAGGWPNLVFPTSNYEKAAPALCVRSSRTNVNRWSTALDASHVWQARFYDFVVFTEKKRVEKLGYMHRNPVKRGLALEPRQWQWSSYRHYADGERGIVLVNEEQVAKMRVRKIA